MYEFVQESHAPEGIVVAHPLGQFDDVLSVLFVVVAEIFEVGPADDRLGQNPIEILFVVPMEVSLQPRHAFSIRFLFVRSYTITVLNPKPFNPVYPFRMSR